MPANKKLAGRYEITEVLGQGGMGVVYKAYDPVTKREVAVKTIRDITGAPALQLFHKECDVLASMTHPNIIEIFDIGEFEEEGKHKPFFVMPLLRGAPLDKLIHTASYRLTVERSVEIISQACRGLHAAHERGLVHRDLKPSNVFVLEDDSVKVIDFGVAHMVESGVTRGLKGTLTYMSPEQIEMKPLSALSDLFALGVVTYETLTQRQPFDRPTSEAVIDAILHQIPPPASDLNPSVSQLLSRTVHKAMAKQPWHRYSNAREFADTLHKALRNEPIEFFDMARLRPRIERAKKAFEQGDYQFAVEILSELEAQGHIDPEIAMLRRQIDQMERQNTIRQLLDSARRRFEEDEYLLALQKIQDVLQLDPENAPALGLKSTIENKRTERKIEDWFSLAQQHINNHAYSHARQAIQNVLELRPQEVRARQLLAEVDRREQEYLKLRSQKEQLYQAAQQAWQNGEVTTALSRMEAVLDLERRAPGTGSGDRTSIYQNFYNQVRSEHDTVNNAYSEARKHLADRNFSKALTLCDQFLVKYPNQALFQALKFEVEEQQRQELSAFIAEVDRRLENEPDLEKRVQILQEALSRYPGESHFEKSLRLTREKRDLVNSIVAKARYYEERNQFNEALGQWDILRTIFAQFPGLDFEIERVTKRRDQQTRAEAKARLVEEIDRYLQSEEYPRAIELLQEAKGDFPGDPELGELEKLVQQGQERAAQVQALLAQGKELRAQNQFEQGIEVLRQARQLDERNLVIAAALADALVEQAKQVVETDWRKADELADQALQIIPNHALAKSLRTLAADHKREEVVDQCLSQARQLQTGGDFEAAAKRVEEGIAQYPRESRLSQLHATLQTEIAAAQLERTQRLDVEQFRALNLAPEAAGPGAGQAAPAPPKSAGPVPPPSPAFPSSAGVQDSRVPAPPGSGQGPPGGGEVTAVFGPGLWNPPRAPEASPNLPRSAVPPEIVRATGPSTGHVGSPQPPDAVQADSGGGDATALFGGAPWRPPQSATTTPEASPSSASSGPAGSMRGDDAQTARGPYPAHESSGDADATSLFGSSQWNPSARSESPAGVPSTVALGGQPPQPPLAVQGESAEGDRAAALAEPTPAETPIARKTLPRWALPAAGVALAALITVVLILLLKPSPPQPPPAFSVDIRTTPSGANIKIDGQAQGASPLTLSLSAGPHQVEVEKDGFQTLAQQISIQAGANAPIELGLQPVGQALRLYTDLAEGKVELDGKSSDLQDGQFTQDGVNSGSHALKVSGQNGEATITFELAENNLPVVKPPMEGKGLKVIAIAGRGGELHVYSSFGPLKAGVDDRPAQDVGQDGLALNDLSPGTHKLVLEEEKEKPLSKDVEVSAAPALTIFLNSGRSVGALVVVTGEEGVRVSLNGKLYRSLTNRKGSVRVPDLAPGQYTVAVSKQGFGAVPPQTIEIQKGQDATLKFQLPPLTASLRIEGALPGTQVLVDGTLLGTVQEDGKFSSPKVKPGVHQVELRKDGYKPITKPEHFGSTGEVRLGPADSVLEPATVAMGTLLINVAPRPEGIGIQREGESAAKAIGPGRQDVQPGSYNIVAVWPSGTKMSKSVKVESGTTQSVDFMLPKGGMADWENPGGWARNGPWYVHEGGDFVLYRLTPIVGAFQFSTDLSRGSRVQWVVDYKDSNNYLLFEMDGKFFYRSQVTNGSQTMRYKVSRGEGSALRVEILPGRIIHQLYRDGAWAPLDTWDNPGGRLGQGKFGFKIPDGERVRLSNFSFQAE